MKIIPFKQIYSFILFSISQKSWNFWHTEYIGGWFENYMQSQGDGSTGAYQSFFQLVTFLGGTKSIFSHKGVLLCKKLQSKSCMSSDLEKMDAKDFSMLRR